MNALQKYLNETGINAYQFSLLLGVAPSTVTRHLSGQRGMTLEMAKIYHKAGVPWEVLLEMVPAEMDGKETGKKE